MSPAPPMIEALARRQRLNGLSDVAVATSAALFLALSLHLADRSLLRPLRLPASDAEAPYRTARAAGADLGTPVIEERPAPSDPPPDNDLQRRVASIRTGLRDAVSGREIDGVTYVSLPVAMAMVDGEARWEAGNRAALGIWGDGLARLEVDSSKARLNGQPRLLPGPARRLDDLLYIPARGLATLYGATIGQDHQSGLLRVEVKGRAFPVISEEVFRIEICREGRWLKVYYAGRLAKEYPICTGAGDNTPVGHFHIQNKAEWPSWRAYWGEYMPGGSPRNPLGARWLGTTARGRVTGWPIGIHGTNDPSSIGERISGGCIRTHNRYAIELYETIPIGTPVWIHE